MEQDLAQDVPFLAAPSKLQNALIGPYTAGYQVQFILFGILVQHMISYQAELKTHSRLSQWTAIVVVGLNVVYTAICFEDGYNLAASSDRSVNTLFNGSLEWQFLPLLNGFIAATAEAFLTLRAGAFFLDRKAKIAFYVWQAALILLVLFGSIASFAEGVIGVYEPEAEERIPYNTGVAIWLWACAAADTSISIALAYNLHKRIAHFNDKTDSVLRKLILVGLRTASFTAVLSVAGAVMSSIYSGWDLSKVALPSAFWVPTGALYGVSLFTTLSSTRQIVENRLGSSPTSTSKPQHSGRRHLVSGFPKVSAASPRDPHHPIPLEINVHREIVRDVDIDEEKSESAGQGSFERDKRGRGTDSIV